MNCNQSFFRRIESEKSSYWLGFIAADGCVSPSRNTLQIKLSLSDSHHLEDFRKTIESQREVKRYAKYAQFRIDNRYIHSDLSRHGIFPRKSLVLSWDKLTCNITPEYIWHFIRGYFDGDGCWGTKGTKSRYRNSIVFTISSGSLDFCSGVVKFMNQNNIRIALYSSRSQRAFRAQTCRLEYCQMLYHMMYDNANVYLKRKKDRAVRLFGGKL